MPRTGSSLNGMKTPQHRPDPPSNNANDPPRNNVAEIARLEREALHERTLSDRASDVMTNIAGTGAFIWAHVVWFSVWIFWNRAGQGFDPFPYSLLTTIVSLEAILLSTFVLINQRHQSRLAERRAHLDLQIDVLAEQEMTVVLRMLRRISEKLDVEVESDEELRELFNKTDLHKLMEEVHKQIPEA